MENPQLHYWMGETTSFSLWKAHFSLFFYLSPLLLAHQGTQGHHPFVYSSPDPLDTSGHALGAKKMPMPAICVLWSALQGALAL